MDGGSAKLLNGTRRRRGVLVGAIATSASVALIVGAPILETFTSVTSPITHQTDQLLSLFDRRSPGKRTSAELAKAHRVLALDKTLPSQRGLSGSLAPNDPQDSLKALTSPLSSDDAYDFLSLPTLNTSPGEAASALPIAPYFDQRTIGGGEFGGVPPSADAPTLPPLSPPIPPIAPAIPEPATWLLMLFGFGAIAWSIRRHGCSLTAYS